MKHFNEKYSMSLRKQVIGYFKNHTARECAKKFNLTHGQIIGLLETSRRKGILPPRYKDKRTKKPWTTEEYVKAVQMAGILPRSEIARKLKRANARTIKEKFQTFKSGTKFLNGMPAKWAAQLWGEEIIAQYKCKTMAGPTGGKRASNFHFIIVPWFICEMLSGYRDTPENVKTMIRTMAKFQRWIFNEKNDKRVMKKIEGMLYEQRNRKG